MLDKLRVDAGRLDRMGLPEAERSSFEVTGHDPGCIGLSDVASLWQGENIHSHI